MKYRFTKNDFMKEAKSLVGSKKVGYINERHFENNIHFSLTFEKKKENHGIITVKKMVRDGKGKFKLDTKTILEITKPLTSIEEKQLQAMWSVIYIETRGWLVSTLAKK